MNDITYGENYYFYESPTNRSIICTTYYKGKIIKGIAKCDPNDDFDLETGRRLAYLRCKKKFLKRKYARAIETYSEAYSAFIKAEKYKDKTADFLIDVKSDFADAKKELAQFEVELGI